MQHENHITIDGSAGEGGGQVLRSSLTLSLVTGRPFRIQNIRAARKRPGLLRQHLTAVRAAADIGKAQTDGATLGSERLSFVPGAIHSGRYRFAVGTAGSATLVLQTVLPVLLTAPGPSELTLEGGTHNPWAPPLDFLERALLPIVRRMGPEIETSLQRHGFYPAGGGVFSVRIEPVPKLRRVDLPHRGDVLHRETSAVVSRLPIEIARREVRTVLDRLGWPEDCGGTRRVDSAGPGNCVTIELAAQHVTELFTGFGRKGVPAQRVAAEAADQARRYLSAGVPVGEHLADQLLVPMAIAGGGSFTTVEPSSHTRTNIEVIRRFLDVEVRTTQLSHDVWQIDVQQRPASG